VEVVLVVARHEQDRAPARPPARELYAGGALSDVTGEHYHIGIDGRELEGGELDVEVADDV
jgi:hypothetical protein